MIFLKAVNYILVRYDLDSEEYYVAIEIRKYKKKMIYLENVEIHHLPSNVARVYGDERDVNIIANKLRCKKNVLSYFLHTYFKINVISENAEARILF